MLFTEWSIYYAQGTKNCQGERRREDVPKAFCIYRLLSDQLAQPEWTVDALQLFVLLNDWVGSTNGPGAAETAASFVGSGVGDCCILRGLWSRRLLHPPWALELLLNSSKRGLMSKYSARKKFCPAQRPADS